MERRFLHEGTGLLPPDLDAERREHPRRTMKLKIMVAVGKTVLRGVTENLSAAGACVRLDETLAAETNLAVRLLTPYMQEFNFIDVAAKVQYSSLTSGTPPYRVGIKIVNADAEAKRRLELLIRT